MHNLFLFVTANEYEKEAFLDKFKCEETKYVKAKSYKLGRFGLYKCAYIHIDEQGPTNPAAIPIVGELVRIIKPIGVVMVGIAFGADEQTQGIGDVLISQKILCYDAEKVRENESVYKEDIKEVGFQLFNAFGDIGDWKFEIGESSISKIHKGAMLTGSKLINHKGFKEKLLEDFNKYSPIGGEMEAYGIYSLCRLHGVSEWIIAKGICDWAYNKECDKEKNQKIASKAAVDYCYHVFSRKEIFNDLLKPIDSLEDAVISESMKNYDKAVVFFEKEEYHKAMEVLVEIEATYVRDNKSNQKDFYKMLGISYLHMGVIQDNFSQAESNLKKAINSLEKSKNLIEDINDENDVEIYKYLIRSYIEMADYKNPSQYYHQVIQLSNDIIKELSKDDRYSSELLSFMIDLALAYENLFDISPFVESANNLLSAQTILLNIYKNNDFLHEVQAFRLLHNLGRVYYKLAELFNREEYLDDAMTYYRQALKVPIAHIEEDALFYAQTYVNIGNIYLKKSSTTNDSDDEVVRFCNMAIENYSIALDVYLHKPFIRELAMTYSNLATANLKLYKTTKKEKHYLASEEDYQKALEYRNALSDPVGYAKTQKGLGELYLAKGSQDDDIDFLDKAFNIFNKVLTIFTKERYIKYYCMIKYYQAIVYKYIAINNNSPENFYIALDILKNIVSHCPPGDDSELINEVNSQINEIADCLDG